MKKVKLPKSLRTFSCKCRACGLISNYPNRPKRCRHCGGKMIAPRQRNHEIF